MKRIIRIALFALPLVLTSCSDNGPGSLKPFILPASGGKIERVKKPSPVRYNYGGGRFRDFLYPPAEGKKDAKSKSVNSGDKDRIAVFDLESMSLRGFLSSAPDTFALLSDTDGNSFILRNGKVYDMKKREVPEVSGVIKKKSVVLIYRNGIKELFREKRS